MVLNKTEKYVLELTPDQLDRIMFCLNATLKAHDDHGVIALPVGEDNLIQYLHHDLYSAKERLNGRGDRL